MAKEIGISTINPYTAILTKIKRIPSSTTAEEKSVETDGTATKIPKETIRP
jgi:hypothetical protein